MLGLFDAFPKLRMSPPLTPIGNIAAGHIPRSKTCGSQIPPLSTFAPSHRRVWFNCCGNEPDCEFAHDPMYTG